VKGKPEARKPSRIVVEFEGPGSANILETRFSNVTPAQIYAWAKWAELQAQAVFVQAAAREAAKRPQVMVAGRPLRPQ
jgi:hypothetical protein